VQIEIVAVGVENKGKYRVASVTYKNTESGKVDAKKVMSFTYPDAFKTLSESKQGDVFDVTAQKNDKGYWDWIQVAPAGKNTGAEATKQGYAKATSTSRDFETSEERAKKQVYIVRQSSISAAVELAKLNQSDGASPDDIIRMAKEFEAYVFDVALPGAEVDVQ
jgi:hypothetical protein